MGLMDRVARVFGRGAGAQGAAKGLTTSDAAPRAAGQQGPLDIAAELRAARDRRAIVLACREMYEGDTRAEGVIRTLARDIVRGGCGVEVTGVKGQESGVRSQESGVRSQGAGGQARRAQEVADALLLRLDLNQRLDDWVRLTLRDGDSFLELSVDEGLEIAAVTRKPTLEVRRASNEWDRFGDPARAFWQGDDWWPGGPAPVDAVWFAEWQMIHGRWGHDEGSRYGRPLFGSATAAFKRIKEGETDIAVRRKTRAGLKYVHKFPDGTDRSVIEEYKQLNRDSLENPTAAIADFFGSVAVDVVQGDAQLSEIGDVLHHIRTWWLASPAPMSLLGYGQDLNRDVLEKQEEQYQRALEGLTAWPETEFVKPLLERQWLLAGIWPAGLVYTIKWQAKQPLTAANVQKAADAGLKLKAIGWPDELVARVLGMLLPGVDVIMSGGNEGQGRTGAAGQTEAGRVAEVAARLGSG
ncbi:MAG: hypothetical protein NTU85_03445 [Candidatus Kaiserbacteria bacterium]|nr:hypothetical protein [Candidatus Kaiserbacteria bacterium]